VNDSLGLSVGMTNLGAARSGWPPALRRSILTLYPDRAPEVGAPEQNSPPGEHGMVLAGFVERVGDPIPLIAADGSTHRPGRLLVEALESLMCIPESGRPPSDIAIAVPAHWDSRARASFHQDLSAKQRLFPAGPPPLISDATASLSALQHHRGLPSRGVVALLDFGGTGTSITLCDAARGWAPIGETMRCTDFGGQQIDQSILARVLSGIAEAANIDPDSTGAVLSLSRLRDQCRKAKETLSADTVATVTAELPAFRSNVRLTRAELEDLVVKPLGGVIAALEETLDRNRIPIAHVAAIATVGGGANIPLVTQRLSQHLRIPVVTTPRPELAPATGAALIAARGPAAPATAMAPAAHVAAGVGAAGAAVDSPATETFRALAWSDDVAVDEPLPYSGETDDDDPATADPVRPQLEFIRDPDAGDEEAPFAWYRRPQLLLGVAAAAVLLTGGGLTYTLTSSSGSPAPAPVPSAVPVVVQPQAPPPAAGTPPPAKQAPAPVIVRQAPAAPRVQPRPASPPATRRAGQAPVAPPPAAPAPSTSAPPTTSAPTTTTSAPTTTTSTSATSTSPTSTEPTSSQPPSSSEPPTTTQAPTAAQVPSTTQAPVATPPPMTTQAPAATEAPVNTPEITFPSLPSLPGL
jgi:Hsp70 protein